MKNRGICFLRYDLLIPMVDGGGLESTIPNQWPLAEEESQMINSILNTLSSHPNIEKKSEEGCEVSKSIGFSLLL